MAIVRCPCGATREVGDDRLGQFVACPACKDLFLAEAVAGEPPPPSAPKVRIGDLAVERGLVSREHLDLCVEYQEALRAAGGAATKRLGEILVDKGLLKPPQVDDLLREQRGEAPTRRPAPARPLPRAQDAAPLPERAEPARRPGRPWKRYLALAVLVAAGAAAAVALWPVPAAQRTLEAYLRGCGEHAARSADYLALRDLGITVRQFRVAALLPAVQADYTPDLRVFLTQRDRGTWEEFCRTIGMPIERRRTLELVLPSLSQALTPKQAGSLAITVQPITVSLLYRPRGEELFKRAVCRFILLRADSARWSSDWCVAEYEPLGSSRAER